MRRRIFAVLLVVGLGCSSPSSWANDYLGTWHLDVPATAGCWPAFQLTFAIDQDDVASASDELFNTVATWHFTSSPATGGATTGNINRLAHTFAIDFNQGSFRTTFQGSDPTAARLAGQFSDPDGIFNPTPGCTAPAVATRQ